MSKGMLTQNSRTFVAKAPEMAAEAKWHIIDAEGLVLGRMAAEIANLIRGKHKAGYTPHVNCGDKVVVINAEKIYLTGKKRQDKIYYWHTGYPGGIKNRTAAQILDGNHPERVLKAAVRRMLPDGPLSRQVLGNLHVYAGKEHKHEAQKPTPYDFAGRNAKNANRH